LRTKRERERPLLFFSASPEGLKTDGFPPKISEELEKDPALQKNLHIFIKNRENRLDISKIFFYDIKLAWRAELRPASTAMNREIVERGTSGEYVR